MAEHDQPLVTQDVLDLTMVAPPARTLRLYVGRPRESRDFRIRGRVDVDRMIRFLQLETAINDALAADDENALIGALDQANREIRDILLDLNDADQVPDHLGLDEQQTLITLAWFSGDISVADAIAHALTGGASGAKTAEELGADGEAAEAGAGGADADAPLASGKRS